MPVGVSMFEGNAKSCCPSGARHVRSTALVACRAAATPNGYLRDSHHLDSLAREVRRQRLLCERSQARCIFTHVVAPLGSEPACEHHPLDVVCDQPMREAENSER